MSNTNKEQLLADANDARGEVEKLRQRIALIPERLANIARDLKRAKDETAICDLIDERARIQKEREVESLLIPRAQIRAIRAEAAYVRALEHEARQELTEVVRDDEVAKANLENAQERATLAAKKRGRTENTCSDLAARAQKLEHAANELEASIDVSQ